MVAWYWVVVAFVAGLVFTAFSYEWWGEYFVENIATKFIALVALIVLFIPLTIYNIFFKLTVHRPVRPDQWEKYLREMDKTDRQKRIGNSNFYVCRDADATHIYNKVFFVRVK